MYVRFEGGGQPSEQSDGGLPRPLQQILFETADGLTAPPPPRPSGLVSISTA